MPKTGPEALIAPVEWPEDRFFGHAEAWAQTVLEHVGLDPETFEEFELQGMTAKARGAYQDFLALCKDADPDIPVFKQAKSEYAKLQ